MFAKVTAQREAEVIENGMGSCLLPSVLPT